MDKVRGIYQGFLALSFMFFIAASFMCICFLGYCDKEWLNVNILISCAVEIVLVIWGILFLRAGSREIIEETHSIKLVKELFNGILYPMGFTIVFACMLYLFSSRITGEFKADAILIYSLNLISVASIFFVWSMIVIRKINRVMRLWKGGLSDGKCLIKKAIGITITFF